MDSIGGITGGTGRLEFIVVEDCGDCTKARKGCYGTNLGDPEAKGYNHLAPCYVINRKPHWNVGPEC